MRRRAATTSSRRAMSSRWSRATAACWCAPAIPRRRSTSRGSPGSIPSGVICEIMNDDGTMARLDDLVAFAQLHNLKIGTIRDLIAYRRRHDHLVEQRAEARFTSRLGRRLDRDDLLQQGDRHRADRAGQGQGSIPTKPTLVRMHALSPFADMFGEGGARGGLLAALDGDHRRGRRRRDRRASTGRRTDAVHRARCRRKAGTLDARRYGGTARLWRRRADPGRAGRAGHDPADQHPPHAGRARRLWPVDRRRAADPGTGGECMAKYPDRRSALLRPSQRHAARRRARRDRGGGAQP